MLFILSFSFRRRRHHHRICPLPISINKKQSQIENKIGTIENVIEMLNGILNADKSDNESPMKMAKQALKPAQSPNSDDSSPERLKTKVIESLSKKRKDSDRSRNDE